MEEDLESRAVTTGNRSSKSPTLEDLGLSHSALAYDNKFVCSPPGMLMFGEIEELLGVRRETQRLYTLLPTAVMCTVCGLLVWTLLGGTEYLQVPALGWVMFVSVACWVLTVCLLVVHLTTAYTKIPHVPWSTVGLCFNSSATILYMTAAVINATSVPQAIRGRYYHTSWIASTVFAFLVVLCYAANSYMSYKSWRSKSDDA